MKHLKFAATLALGALLGPLALAADPATPAPGHSTSVPLAPDAPASYTVQRGDTLWGISSKYLTQPWYWPEIWYLNPEIKNPHRIYPGDTLRLVYDGTGRPHLELEPGPGRDGAHGDSVRLSPRVRTTPLSEAIPAIPYEIVAAFMSKPSVISREEAKTLPYVVAIGAGERVVAGMGDTLYARGLAGAAAGQRLNIVHVGEPMRDPDDNALLGYQGIYTGTARIDRPTSGGGRDALAKLSIEESARETLDGDRLIRDRLEVPLDFVPHAPAKRVNGRIMAVVDGVAVIGQYQVIILNRGRRHGLEPGTVLAIWQNGEKVKDRGPGNDSRDSTFLEPLRPTVHLPAEKAGTVMVFRAYDRMSYGLIVEAASGVHVGDTIKNP